MNRGDVYWVDLEPTKGAEIRKIRPCVIITVNPVNRARRTVVVVPLSTAATPRPPLVIPLSSAGDPNAVAVCDQIRAVDKARLNKQIGHLTAADLIALENGLKKVLGL